VSEALERLELRRLVAEYADARKTWRPLVRHDRSQRVFEQLPPARPRRAIEDLGGLWPPLGRNR
jgi:hypothetical protein